MPRRMTDIYIKDIYIHPDQRVNDYFKLMLNNPPIKISNNQIESHYNQSPFYKKIFRVRESGLGGEYDIKKKIKDKIIRILKNIYPEPIVNLIEMRWLESGNPIFINSIIPPYEGIDFELEEQSIHINISSIIDLPLMPRQISRIHQLLFDYRMEEIQEQVNIMSGEMAEAIEEVLEGNDREELIRSHIESLR